MKSIHAILASRTRTIGQNRTIEGGGSSGFENPHSIDSNERLVKQIEGRTERIDVEKLRENVVGALLVMYHSQERKSRNETVKKVADGLYSAVDTVGKVISFFPFLGTAMAGSVLFDENIRAKVEAGKSIRLREQIVTALKERKSEFEADEKFINVYIQDVPQTGDITKIWFNSEDHTAGWEVLPPSVITDYRKRSVAHHDAKSGRFRSLYQGS